METIVILIGSAIGTGLLLVICMHYWKRKKEFKKETPISHALINYQLFLPKEKKEFGIMRALLLDAEKYDRLEEPKLRNHCLKALIAYSSRASDSADTFKHEEKVNSEPQ